MESALNQEKSIVEYVMPRGLQRLSLVHKYLGGGYVDTSMRFGHPLSAPLPSSPHTEY